MSVSSFQWHFLFSASGWFYRVVLSVQKEESIARAEFPCPLKICWSSCLHLPCHAATLELLTGAVVETGPAVSLLSSATDYYLLNITNDRAWCGANAVLTSSLASKLSVISWAQCAKGYLARFQFSEQVTMLQRALALSVMKGGGQFIPCPVLLCYLLGFRGSPGGWVLRKALGKISKGRTLAGAIVMARKETKTDLFPPVLVQLLGLLFSLYGTLNIFLKLCWGPFLPYHIQRHGIILALTTSPTPTKWFVSFGPASAKTEPWATLICYLCPPQGLPKCSVSGFQGR